MPIKFFCKKCGKEMWQGMDRLMKETTTIAEAEDRVKCSDCILEEVFDNEYQEEEIKNAKV